MTLLNWLTFLLRSLIVIPTVLFFWISFLWHYDLFQNGSPSIGEFWSCRCLSIDVSLNSKRDALFYLLDCVYPQVDWDGLCDHLRDVLWGDICKLGASSNASEFSELVEVKIDVYIPHRKYQYAYWSLWSSVACAAAIAHRNHFFVCSSRINLVKLDRLVLIAKGFFKLPNLHMLIKQKSLLNPWNLVLGTFGELLIVFSTKVNLLYLPYLTAWRSSVSDKVKLIAKNLSSISLLVFPFRTYLKLHNISVTTKLVKRAITNLNFSKAPVVIVSQWRF